MEIYIGSAIYKGRWARFCFKHYSIFLKLQDMIMKSLNIYSNKLPNPHANTHISAIIVRGVLAYNRVVLPATVTENSACSVFKYRKV